MTKINWKRKLSSRKFWAALITFVTAILAVFNIDSMTTQQVAGIITASGTMMVYILGESIVDATNKGGTKDE